MIHRLCCKRLGLLCPVAKDVFLGDFGNVAIRPISRKVKNFFASLL